MIDSTFLIDSLQFIWHAANIANHGVDNARHWNDDADAAGSHRVLRHGRANDVHDATSHVRDAMSHVRVRHDIVAMPAQHRAVPKE